MPTGMGGYQWTRSTDEGPPFLKTPNFQYGFLGKVFILMDLRLPRIYEISLDRGGMKICSKSLSQAQIRDQRTGALEVLCKETSHICCRCQVADSILFLVWASEKSLCFSRPYIGDQVQPSKEQSGPDSCSTTVTQLVSALLGTTVVKTPTSKCASSLPIPILSDRTWLLHGPECSYW